jgi:hypothetical protein
LPRAGSSDHLRGIPKSLLLCAKNSTPKSLKPLHSNTSRDRTRESAFEGIFQLARSHIRTDSFSILEAHRPKLDGFRNRDQ